MTTHKTVEEIKEEIKRLIGVGKYSKAFDLIDSALTLAQAQGAEEERKQLLRQIDIGDNDYLTARKAVAEISGVPFMAITFDEHLKVIKSKLQALNTN